MQRFTGISAPYIYIAGGEAFPVGYVEGNGTLADSLQHGSFSPGLRPRLELLPVKDDEDRRWIMATLPVGGIAAFIWRTPIGTKEVLYVRAVEPCDMLHGDSLTLTYRRACLRIMMATRHPLGAVSPVWFELRDVDAAVRGINLVTWLMVTRQREADEVRAWLEANQPGAPCLNGDALRAWIAGSGLERLEWTQLSAALRAAHRFTHPK